MGTQSPRRSFSQVATLSLVILARLLTDLVFQNLGNLITATLFFLMYSMGSVF